MPPKTTDNPSVSSAQMTKWINKRKKKEELYIKRRVLGYIRVGSNAPLDSSEKQLNQIKVYCYTRNYELVDVKVDNCDVSESLEDRQGWVELYDKLMAGEANAVICCDIERLTLDNLEALTVFHELQRREISFICKSGGVFQELGKGFDTIGIELAFLSARYNRPANEYYDELPPVRVVDDTTSESSSDDEHEDRSASQEPIVLGYARISCKTQETSLDNQEAAIRSYCEKKGLRLLDVYKEQVSGSKPCAARKEMKKLLARLYSGEANMVVCNWFDRLSRNSYDTLLTLEEFKRRKIQFLCVHQG